MLLDALAAVFALARGAQQARIAGAGPQGGLLDQSFKRAVVVGGSGRCAFDPYMTS
jgi:hypothetical protein